METNLKDRILTYMKEDAFRPMLAEDIAEGMNLTAEEQVAFPAALEALEQEALVIKNRSDLYGIPSRMHLVVGKLTMTAKGFGFIIPDVKETEEDTDVFVPGVALGTAMQATASWRASSRLRRKAARARARSSASSSARTSGSSARSRATRRSPS